MCIGNYCLLYTELDILFFSDIYTHCYFVLGSSVQHIFCTPVATLLDKTRYERREADSSFEWPPSACRKYLYIRRSDQLSEVGWLQSSFTNHHLSKSLCLMRVSAATERSYWLGDPELPPSRGERGSNQDNPRLPSKWWAIWSITRALSEKKLFSNIFFLQKLFTCQSLFMYLIWPRSTTVLELIHLVAF